MRFALRFTFQFLALIVFTTVVQAQITPGKSYSIKNAALYNDIEMFLSARFNSVDTRVQMDRMESQSVWQFVPAGGGYKMMDVKHKGYIFQQPDGRFMITNDENQAKVFYLEPTATGNYYFKASDGTVLTSSLILMDGQAARAEKVQKAEWMIKEIYGQ